jgi:hypothetical protein
MVMGWFVVLMVGEKTVSSAADARRSAEDTAQQAASKTSTSYCQGGASAQSAPGLPRANANPSVAPNGTPEAQRALMAIAGLGIPRTQTFPYYTDPLKNVKVEARSQADKDDDRARGKTFLGERQLGCLERPLDSPKGTLDQYRHPLWQKNLQGY